MSVRIKAPRPGALRDEVGEVLASSGNRFLLIQALIVLMINVALYFSLSSLFSAFFLMISKHLNATGEFWLWVGFGVVIALFLVFFSLPMLLGLLGMAQKMTVGEECVLVDLFWPFSSKAAYRRALGLSYALLWRLGGVILLVWSACGHFQGRYSGGLLGGFLCFAAVVVGLAALLLLCMRGSFRTAVVLSEERTVSESRSSVHRIARAAPLCGARFWIGFLPQILLGLLTFGVFLIWEVLPRMCVSYFLYHQKINETITRMEEIEHE